jgi:hypothetical protein
MRRIVVMNKRTRLLAFLGLLVGLAGPAANGQVQGVKVKVPFKYVVANKTLPGGEYTLSSVRDELFVQDSEGKRVAMVSTNAVSGGRTVGKTGEVVFKCYTDVCFLSQLWTPGQDTGRELLRSPLETGMAKRETGKNFALLDTQPSK